MDDIKVVLVPEEISLDTAYDYANEEPINKYDKILLDDLNVKRVNTTKVYLDRPDNIRIKDSICLVIVTPLDDSYEDGIEKDDTHIDSIIRHSVKVNIIKKLLFFFSEDKLRKSDFYLDLVTDKIII